MLSFSRYSAKYRYFSRLANQRNTVIVLFTQSYKSVIVLLFCPVPVSLLSGTNRDGKHRWSLIYVSVHNVATSTCIHAFCILMVLVLVLLTYTTSGNSVLMVYVQYSTSSHNLQIYRIWCNSILIMRELTMVGGFVMKCVPTLEILRDKSEARIG